MSLIMLRPSILEGLEDSRSIMRFFEKPYEFYRMNMPFAVKYLAPIFESRYEQLVQVRYSPRPSDYLDGLRGLREVTPEIIMKSLNPIERPDEVKKDMTVDAAAVKRRDYKSRKVRASSREKGGIAELTHFLHSCFSTTRCQRLI